jgi:hypothetical protein
MIMRKAQAEERMLFIVGAIVISLIAIVFVSGRLIPSLESSMEGQAKVMANMIAVSVNSLSTMDAGYVQKSFDVKEPFVVEVYDKDKKGVMYVKVTYDSKNNKFSEVPLLVKIDPIAPISLDRVYVMKDLGGNVYVKGDLSAGRDLTEYGDAGCSQPTPMEIKEYIKEASQKYGVEEARIKATMMQESRFCQCRDCRDGGPYLRSSANAIGLMQLLVSTAAGVGANPYNARENVMGGAAYLKKMYDQFGSWELAHAAYNAGPGWLMEKTEKCQKDCHECMKICGLTTSSTSKDIQNCACLPKETRDYVPLVMGYYSSCYAQGAACSEKGCKLC